MSETRTLTLATVVALALGWSGAAAALTPADKCEAAKNNIAGKYGFCRQTAEAKAIKTGAPVDYSECDTHYSLKWMKAETDGGGMCPTNGDESAMQSCIVVHTGKVASALNGGTCASGGLAKTGQTQCDQGAGTLGACPGSPPGQDGAVLAGAARSYTDNGDGTITDNVTGLIWEKLSDDGTIHDVDDPYTWYTAFTKIAALNTGGGFAGHTDWRLPNEFELFSLLDLGHEAPSIDPVFNTACAATCTVTTCSCTNPGEYWSSTPASFDPAEAWIVVFTDLNTDFALKSSFTAKVRAVRGGS